MVEPATGGRGLQIVAAVAEQWGVAEFIGGKDVCFRMRGPPSWTPQHVCRCLGGPRTSPGGLPLRRSPS